MQDRHLLHRPGTMQWIICDAVVELLEKSVVFLLAAFRRRLAPDLRATLRRGKMA